MSETTEKKKKPAPKRIRRRMPSFRHVPQYEQVSVFAGPDLDQVIRDMNAFLEERGRIHAAALPSCWHFTDVLPVTHAGKTWVAQVRYSVNI